MTKRFGELLDEVFGDAKKEFTIMGRDTAQVTVKPQGRDDYEINVSENWDRQQGITIHHLLVHDQVAETALQMMSRWGTVAAIPDGEDSSGRSKLRLQTPEELTEYAFAAAEAFWKRAHELGHVFRLPEAAVRTAMLDEARKTEEGN